MTRPNIWYWRAVLEGVVGFLAIHGLLNLFQTTPVQRSVLAYAWVVASILAAVLLNGAVQRRRSARRSL
jgi:hypothetical protein